jgi:hypothetical protein
MPLKTNDFLSMLAERLINLTKLKTHFDSIIALPQPHFSKTT